MRVALCSDHRGVRAKECIANLLHRDGHQVSDFGCDGTASCDYPDFALPAAHAVASGEQDVGVMICGTGIGMSITANKVCGVRAAVCQDELTAELSRKHNDANVLCLSADLLGEELLKRIVEAWLNTPFEAGRHARRVQKITDFERSMNGSETCHKAAGGNA